MYCSKLKYHSEIEKNENSWESKICMQYTNATYIGEFSQTLFNFKKLIQDKNTPMHFTLAQVAMQEIKNDE